MPFDAIAGKLALEHNQKQAFEACLKLSEMEMLN
jgi:hypothetical protein